MREYVKSQFVDNGMAADICFHDMETHNPHAHILLTMRPFDEDRTWGTKQKKEYILDPQGEKIYDPKKRQYKCKSIPTTDWSDKGKADTWREAYTVYLAVELCPLANKEVLNPAVGFYIAWIFEYQG